MFFCVIGGLAMSLILNVILIPPFKEIGSSIANICSEIVVTLLYFYFIKRDFSFTYEWSLIVKAVSSALIFIPVIWLARELSVPLVVTLILSIVTCGITYVGLQWLLFRNRFVLEIIEFVRVKLKGGE